MKKGIKISSILLLCSLFVQILSVDAYGYINYGNISYSYNEKK